MAWVQHICLTRLKLICHKTAGSTELLVQFNIASQQHLLWFCVLLLKNIICIFIYLLFFIKYYLLSSVCQVQEILSTKPAVPLVSWAMVWFWWFFSWMSFDFACVILFCRFHPVDVKSHSWNDVPICRPHPIQGWNLTILWEKRDEGFQGAVFGIMAVGEWDVRSGT